MSAQQGLLPRGRHHSESLKPTAVKPFHFLASLSVACVCLLLAACSTKKNTAGTRFWHSFTARYNTYYNGHEAYKAGNLSKEEGNKDNYTELLPLFMVGNEKSRTIGSGDYETAITKCEKAIQLHSIKRRPAVTAGRRQSAKARAYLKRKEFNPFLKNAWLLMGKAQFQKGDFLEAASTFAYITRHYAAEPPVVAEARVWLARSYAQLEWYYDAEDALAKLRRDSVPRGLDRETDATMADLLLRQGRLADAVPYLQRTARREPRKAQRARLYFLLGQVENALGRADASYRAYAKCIRQQPAYELAFNARIRQTEVLSGSQGAKKMIARLRRMARSANNKDYLDQVYYAMGNIHLSQADTAQAVDAYETGRAKSTRGGAEKGVLLLRLGELYWDMGRYDKAQSCYAEAIGLIDKTHREYEETTRRSKVLDELVPFTSAVYLQDSLQTLAAMSESDRNAAIDRIIEALRQREKAEARARADSLAEARKQEGGENNAATTAQGNNRPAQGAQNKSWYFYDQMTVNQGKLEFQKQWGRRKNEDDWRRSNRTVLADASDDSYDYAAEDSIAAAEDSAALAGASGAAAEQADSAAADPHRREYYLKDIPFTPEAKAESDAIITDGLYNAGIIEKDKLEDFPLASRTLERLVRQYPDFDRMADVYYQLFLLYSRWQQPARADEFRRLLAQQYPDNDTTRLITAPDFEYNARFGPQLEDSLYTATYEAYSRHDHATVERNFARSSEKYPTGANRPKFIFIHALSRIGRDPDDDIARELRDLVTRHPQSDVSEAAGMIVKGLESGRRLGSGGFDIGSLWERRSASANEAVDAAGKKRALSAARDVPFVCVIAYPTDSLSDGQMLYDLAHFNFTGFMLRNFDILQERGADITQLRIAGFNSYDEAHAYAQQLFATPEMAARLRLTRVVLISAENLELLGTTYSFNDYADFYEKNFAPLKINPQLPLDIREEPIEQHYEDEYTPEELQRINEGGGKDDDTDDDGGEWYDG